MVGVDSPAFDGRKELAEIRDSISVLHDLLREVSETVKDLRAGRTPHDPLLSAKDVWAYVRRSSSWFYDAKTNGTLPPPDRVLDGRGGERWHQSTIDRAMRRANGTEVGR